MQRHFDFPQPGIQPTTGCSNLNKGNPRAPRAVKATVICKCVHPRAPEVSILKQLQRISPVDLLFPIKEIWAWRKRLGWRAGLPGTPASRPRRRHLSGKADTSQVPLGRRRVTPGKVAQSLCPDESFPKSQNLTRMTVTGFKKERKPNEREMNRKQPPHHFASGRAGERTGV